MTRILFLIILTIICFSESAWGADVKQELRGIKNEIREKKQLIKKTAQVESAVSSELAEINKNLIEKQNTLKALNRDLNHAEDKLVQTEKKIETVKMDVKNRKIQIQKRLVSIYKAGNVSNIRFYFSAESFPEMLEDMRYTRSLLDNDKKLVSEYKEKIQRLSVLQQNLRKDTRNKEKIKADIEQKKNDIEAEKEKKAQYLAKVKQDKVRYQSSLRELEANSRRLQSIIQKLEAASRKRELKERENATERVKKGITSPSLLADRGFASQKGRLSMPVNGRIISGFGRHKHPRFNSYTFNNGISISAPIGTGVHAVYDGKVIFADYFKGYGNLLIIDHGGGYFSLYAHNSKIMKNVGTTVAKNDIVATVGDGDSTEGPMLYFEIRHQGKPVDPSSWVR